MTLRAYLAAMDETNAAFAKRVGVNERTIERVLAGQACRLKIAQRIVRATHSRPTPSGGFVTFDELVPEEVAA